MNYRDVAAKSDKAVYNRRLLLLGVTLMLLICPDVAFAEGLIASVSEYITSFVVSSILIAILYSLFKK